MLLRIFAITAALTTNATADPFTFVAFGDAPYGAPEEVYPPFETLIDTINATVPPLPRRRAEPNGPQAARCLQPIPAGNPRPVQLISRGRP